ncbi:hypothetical protein LECLMA074M_00370 [Leclercia sp. M-A074-M]
MLSIPLWLYWDCANKRNRKSQNVKSQDNRQKKAHETWASNTGSNVSNVVLNT